MPDKPLQIAAYAAGASLAAATLVYVFGPTFFLDDDAAHQSKSARKRGVVGLSNPANDCFINSVLQALAGLPELRLYLIREMHLRTLAGPDVYDSLPEDEDKDKPAEEKDNEVAPFVKETKSKVPEWKILSLQRGVLSAALKDMLDALNERPIYKKTLSAGPFVTSIEQAFRTRINRNQQDAQELLQLVTERLCDEHHAGCKARDRAAKRLLQQKVAAAEERKIDSALGDGNGADMESTASTTDASGPDILAETLHGDEEKREQSKPLFPFEGKIESQIECTHCHFKPKPSSSSFVTLTLHIPQGGNSTSLSACFDTMLKVEYIDDFRCARCRIQHAIDTKQTELAKSTSDADKTELQKHLELLSQCLKTDPEKPPKDVPLPDANLAPTRRIARHSRISVFPAVLAIHLSRSMWDTTSSSAKNLTKVSFNETLPLGGLLDQTSYRLLATVTHKGGHNSGHYETMRRQAIGLGREPYSTPTNWGTEGVYSTGKVSPASASEKTKSATSLDMTNSAGGTELKRKNSLARVAELAKGRTSKKLGSRWWRISDDKIKECSTRDVLQLQREVYLMFYERVGGGR